MRGPAQAAYLIAPYLRARYGDVSRVSIVRKIKTPNFSRLVTFGGSRWRIPRHPPKQTVTRPIPGKPLAAFNLPGRTKTMTNLAHQPVLDACRAEAVKYLGTRIRRGYAVLETLEQVHLHLAYCINCCNDTLPDTPFQKGYLAALIEVKKMLARKERPMRQFAELSPVARSRKQDT